MFQNRLNYNIAAMVHNLMDIKMKLQFLYKSCQIELIKKHIC